MLHLVGLIYDSAADPSKRADLLRLLGECLRATEVRIVTRHLASGAVLHSPGCEPAGRHAKEYANGWAALDPHADMLARLPPGQVLRCHERFGPEFAAQNSFYQDFLIPRGLRWTMGGLYNSGFGSATIVCALRACDGPAFEDWAAAALGQLLPHFERAAAIGSRLARQTGALHSATQVLKLLPTPCLFTDEAGRCIESNDAFTQSIEMLSLRLVTGRVRFTQAGMQGRWETALYETRATAVGRTLLVSAASGRQWKLHLIPWHAPAQAGEAYDRNLILAVFDEKLVEVQAQPGPASFKSRLTRAEVEVLASLLKGLPAKAIASRRSASVNTVRSQIVAILDKTGYNSQKELIASFGASALPDSAFASSFFTGYNARACAPPRRRAGLVR
jgi:DNA-binding CsgD family transcriptional regulator